MDDLDKRNGKKDAIVHIYPHPPCPIVTTEKVTNYNNQYPPSLLEEMVTNSCHVDSLVINERDRGLKCFLGRGFHINATTTIVPQASMKAFLENITESKDVLMCSDFLNE